MNRLTDDAASKSEQLSNVEDDVLVIARLVDKILDMQGVNDRSTDGQLSSKNIGESIQRRLDQDDASNNSMSYGELSSLHLACGAAYLQHTIDLVSIGRNDSQRNMLVVESKYCVQIILGAIKLVAERLSVLQESLTRSDTH
ncbi:MAG: hypothetical protein M1824_005518 [Vezdaea acicularis]|nr:MAG: hypothetical protein M1824_005518 [Vezdaea acicularis]